MTDDFDTGYNCFLILASMVVLFLGLLAASAILAIISLAILSIFLGG